MVRKTITIPPGARIVGEAWSVIAGEGPAYQDVHNPRVVVRVGTKGSRGIVQISDIIFTTIGPGEGGADALEVVCSQESFSAAGAIIVEWNIRAPDGQLGEGGMWDTHIR